MDAIALNRTTALTNSAQEKTTEAAAETTEAELIARAQAGEQAAFERLFELYYPQIASFCYRLVGERELARDLAQDTFVKAYRALPRTAPDLNLSAWLFTIATNTSISALRRRRRITWLPLIDLHPASPAIHGSVDSIGDRELIGLALARLPRSQAACLMLRLHYGFSYEELAPMFGGSVGAVKTRLSRARRAFRDAYREVAGGDVVAPTGEEDL